MNVSPTDFAIVRFATAPYSFMRVSDIAISPWLEKKGIDYMIKGTRVYFELPEDLNVYTKITPKLAEQLAIVKTPLKRMMTALLYMRARHYREPLLPEEIEALVRYNLHLVI